MKTLLLAIDPGQAGGFAEIWPNGKVDAFPMFDDPDMVEYLKALDRNAASDALQVVCYLELVGGFIGKPQPGSAMFKFGNGYGFIRGVLATVGIPTVLVRPQTWQKGIPGLEGSKGPDRKRALKEQAARLFPSQKVTLSTADALLIADYGKKQTANVAIA